MNHYNSKGSPTFHSYKPIAIARAIMRAFHQIVLTQVCSSFILILYISNLKWAFSKWYQVKITFAKNLNRHQQFYQVFSHFILLMYRIKIKEKRTWVKTIRWNALMIALAIAIGLQEWKGGLPLLLQWFILNWLEFSLFILFFKYY